MKKVINVTIDTEEFLNEVGDDQIINYLSTKGYGVIASGETSKYINLEKSVGTEPFYKLLAQLIDEGKLSLELIIGHVITKRIIESTPKIKP